MNKLEKRPKAVMFDLDDTIVSYFGASEKAWKIICEKFTAENPVDYSADEMKNILDSVKHEYWSDPVRHKWGREHIREARREVMLIAMPKLGISDKELLIKTADEYTDLQKNCVCLFDGSLSALRRIRSAGIKTALITNGSSEGQREKITRFGLEPLFDEIIIDTEVGFSKPDERIFRLALRRLKTSPEETVMIGDNPVWDTEIPQKIGIFSVWNNYAGTSPEEDIPADMTVKNISELADFLLSLNC